MKLYSRYCPLWCLSAILFFTGGTYFPAQATLYTHIPVFTEEFACTNGRMRIPIHVDTDGKAYPDAWPVTGGIPLPNGSLERPEDVCLRNAANEQTPVQTRALAWWPEKKSVKWLEVQFLIRKGETNPVYFLEWGKGVSVDRREPIAIREDADGFDVDAGVLQARVSKKRGSLLESVRVRSAGGEWEALAGPAGFYATLRDIEGDRSGKYSTLRDTRPEVSVERRGPVSVTFLIRAWHQDERGNRTFPLDARLTFYRDQPRVNIFHTFYVSENPAITVFPAIGLEIPAAIHGTGTLGLDRETVSLPGAPLCIWQDSAEVPVYPKCNQFAPFCKVFAPMPAGPDAAAVKKGVKADGWIRVADGNRAMTVTLRRLWQEFPKGFSLTKENVLRVEFWPEIKPDPMCFRRIDQRFPEDYEEFKNGPGQKQRGYEYNMRVYHRTMTKEREFSASAFGKGKSHELWLDFSDAAVPAAALGAAAERPLLPFVTPAWNRYTGTLGVFHPEDRVNFPKIEAAWERVWDTLRAHQQEWFNWYGMFNWGDFQTYYLKDDDRWDNYDTKYGWRNGGMDIPYSIFLWYLRSGQRKYFDLAEIHALHMIDVDSRHPRAWSDERILPRGWGGAGTSRYNLEHWGTGGGLDPEHCFTHSIQIYWLVTGNTYARDMLLDVAGNYYRREKAFNKQKLSGQSIHYHGRETDMPSRLAASAYENDPLDPRWREMLDFHLANQAEGLRSMCVEKGILREKCNSLDIGPFYYNYYKVPALNYLLSVRDCPELAAAFRQGCPLRLDEAGGGLTYALLYEMTGNINYAKFAARQAAFGGSSNSQQNATLEKTAVSTELLGGPWSTYPGLLEAVVKSGVQPHPEQYDDRELNYYPLAQAGDPNPDPSTSRSFEPVDLRELYNGSGDTNDGTLPPAVVNRPNDDILKGPIKFDFGPTSLLAPGSLPVTSESFYPAAFGAGKGLTALPFGAMAWFNGVPFALMPTSTNAGRNLLVVDDNGAYQAPVNLKAKRLCFLTGVSFASDPFHEGAGAVIEVRYADGTTQTQELVNMVHYQALAFKRLYFDRVYFAGRPNTFNISVVGVETSGKMVSFVTIRDTGRKARLCVFAVTTELAEPQSRPWAFEELVDKAGKEPVRFSRKVPNGLYQAALTFEMDQPLGSPLDVFIQDNLVVNHAVPVARTTYEAPVEVTDETLSVELRPGEIHHKARSVEGCVRLHAVRAARLDAPSWFPVARRESASRPLAYGWRLRGERCIMRDMAPGAALMAKTGTTNEEALLNWDASYIDKNGIGRVEFLVDLPNGDYELDLALLATPWGACKVALDVEGTRHEAQLTVFKSSGTWINKPEPCRFHTRVTVKDGQLNLVVALPPKEVRSAFDDCGIASLRIRKTD